MRKEKDTSAAFTTALGYVDHVSPGIAKQQASLITETPSNKPIEHILCAYLILQAAKFISATNAILVQQTDALASIIREDPILLERQDSDGDTLLHIAAGENNAPAVRALLLNGAGMDTVNADGQTPHMMAYEQEHHTVCHVFRTHIEKVCDLRIR